MRLEFKLQQTNCRKKDWKKPECKVKPTGVSEDVCVGGGGTQIAPLCGTGRSNVNPWGWSLPRGAGLSVCFKVVQSKGW